MAEIKSISKETILAVHDRNVELTGGSLGFLDEGLFEFLCEKPFQVVFGLDPFPTVYDKAVELLFGFAQHQVFIDGNKRTAVASMLVFLFGNGIELELDSKEFEQIVLKIANNELDKKEVIEYLKEHTI